MNEIKNNRVTPVIGSGLSMWAGYPSWRSFMLDKGKGTPIETKVSSLMDSNQFEKAMQDLSDYYKPNRFLRVLENEFSTDKIDESMRPAYQKLLPKLFKGSFVTTNYDVCLERLLDAPYTVNPLDEYNEAAINSHLQNNQHFLIKMRGTITDPTHLLVTEESSNAAYGIDPMIPDRSLPLIKTLETVFQSSSPLFLGCSLGADRASMVLQSCMGTTGYALVEMPWNPDDFDMADARFDEMNLQVIWYPHGQHDAVEVLINQLAKDMGVTGSSGPSPSAKRKAAHTDPYAVEKSFIGRDSVVNFLAKKLLKPDTKVLLVHGVAGIGKTEICKAVYQKIRETHPDFSMPFVDVTDAGSLPDFWARLADGLGIATDGMNEKDVLTQIYAKVRIEKPFVYLDNFEDILSALDKEQKNELIDTLYDLTEKCGLRLLVSSQLTINFGECVEIKPLDGEVDLGALSWDELMELDQTKLFVEKFGREPTEAERNSFRKLILELSGHPLSIIITAQYGRDTDSINDLLAVWRDIGTTIPGEEKLGQNSLQFVIVQTWKIIKENSAAVYLWALHSYSKQPLDSDTLNELNHAQEQPFSFVDWLDGSRLLLKHGLTEKTNDGKKYIMHLALKKMFPSLGQEAGEALPRAFDAWIKVCGNVLERGSDQKREDFIACHNRAVSFLPQCFYLAERCLEDEDYAHLSYLLENADNFYMFDVVRSVSLLSMIIEKTPKEFPLRSKFYQSIGDLLNRTGDYNKALEAYDEAEKLYRAEHDNLELANVLRSIGELLRRTGVLEGAMTAYDEAEKLYKAVHDDLGLANVLQSRGYLLIQLGYYEKALEAYDEAEKLFRAVHDDLGLANVLQSRGDLLIQLVKFEEAIHSYDEAEKLYRVENDILQNHKQKITLPNPTDEISCFCGCKIDSDLIKLYLLSEDSVIILKIINFEETVVEKKLPIKMVSKFFKHVKPLNDWVLLSTDESSAYLIKLHESKCEVVELTSGVKCRGLMLGDGENEKRVEDDESYELLRLMNS